MTSHGTGVALLFALATIAACGPSNKSSDSSAGSDTAAPDADGDGALAADDCDDQDASRYPGAAEICDGGVDNDCDDTTDDPSTGSAGFVEAGGAIADLTDSLTGDLSIIAPGTLYLCGGAWTAQLTVAADDVRVVGSGASDTTLDGGQLGSVIAAVGVSGLSIEGVTLSGGYADSGGGLSLSASGATLSDVVLSGNIATVSGGGIFLGDGSSATLSSVRVTGNEAASGGGVWLSASTLTTAGGSFSNNTALSDGGGAALTDGATAALDGLSVENNSAAGRGAGLYLLDGEATLNNGSLDGNVAAGDGGGIYASAAVVNLTRVSLTDNVGYYGGGLRLAAGSSASMSDGAFAGNEAAIGGGVFLSESAATAAAVDFEGNLIDDLHHYESATSHTWGLAARFVCDAVACLDDVDDDGDGFSEYDGDPDDADPYAYPEAGDVDDDGDGFSEADGDCDDDPEGGAAIHPDADEVCDGLDNDCDDRIDDADDSLNRATTPTLYADADYDGFGDPGVSVRACAQEGYVDNDSDSDDTNANVHPGAPELCDGLQNDSEDLSWTEVDEAGLATHIGPTGLATDWTSALASGVDGAPAVETISVPGQLRLCAGTWYANLLLGASDLTVEGAGADVTTLHGGGAGTTVQSYFYDDLSLSGMTITGGDGPYGGGVFLYETSAVLSDLVITDNFADFGGGLFISTDCLVEMTDVTISNNTASAKGYGGGMYVEDEVDLTVTDCTFEDNGASLGGGVALSTSSVLITGSRIAGNTAEQGAGMSIIFSDDVSLYDTTITENIASDVAGGLVMLEASATFDGVTFEANEAASAAGAGYIADSTLTMVDSIITGHDLELAAGLLLDGGLLTLETTEVSDNSADYAAGLYISRGDAVLIDSTFSNNTAIIGAGALVDIGTTLEADSCDFVNNRSDDVYHYSANRAYTWGLGASFSCNSLRCE